MSFRLNNFYDMFTLTLVVIIFAIMLQKTDTVKKRSPKPSIRIFKNPILEWCTHVHPIVPLILWSPVVLFFFAKAFIDSKMTIGAFVATFFLSILFWTLFEYWMHRYLFHFNAKNKVSKYLVFLFHGLHHDDPQDPTRLVFPPVPAVLIVFVLYHGFQLIIPEFYFYAFIGSFLTGYLMYDYVHYATHHFPMTSKLGRMVKKFHLQHHYSGFDAKYGVSSPLWDYVFGTVTGPKSQKH